ncbi:hypothetical protein HK102_008198 [Quaeritorhiza haematococci]|nr:hypothetical protein HK102_008198 [Quaeritorhiza haematococci]
MDLRTVPNTEVPLKPLTPKDYHPPSPTTPTVEVASTQKKNTPVGDFLYGAIAGIAGKIIEFPFDTIKVRLQTQPIRLPEQVSVTTSTPHITPPAAFSGTLDCLLKTVRNEGFFGLYKGLASPLVGSILENSILFATYGFTQQLIRSVSGRTASATGEEVELSMGEICAAGFVSGATVSIVLTPVELVKCRLQVQDVALHVQHPNGTAGQIRYNGPMSVLSHVLKEDGFRGMYRGHFGTFLRESCGGAAWFGTYELVCRWIIETSSSPAVRKKEDLSPFQLMGAGALAGMVFNASLFPADVIKSRQQTDLTTALQRQGFLQVAKELYTGEGIRGFYRGLGITLLRSAPTSGVIFLTYELLSRHFNLGF